jgi:hypothetical protein
MIVGLLLSSKAKLDFDDPASALCAAAGEGDLAQVKRLIENGVDPNLCDYDRRTGDGCRAPFLQHNVCAHLIRWLDELI